MITGFVCYSFKITFIHIEGERGNCPLTFIQEDKRLSNQGHPKSFLENICSEDDLRFRIFGAFVVKFLACLALLGFSNSHLKNGKLPIFNGFLL